MSYDLRGITGWNEGDKDITWSMTGHGFRYFLDMAVAYGWKPSGVFYPSIEGSDLDKAVHITIVYPEEKSGVGDVTSYFSNDGQFVDEEDVKNILMALHNVPEKDESLVKFMSYLSEIKGLYIW